MINKKKMYIVFAVLAAALMLMTPTMARVSQEQLAQTTPTDGRCNRVLLFLQMSALLLTRGDIDRLAEFTDNPPLWWESLYNWHKNNCGGDYGNSQTSDSVNAVTQRYNVETIKIEMKTNPQLAKSVEKLAGYNDVEYLLKQFENTETTEETIKIAEKFINVIQTKPEYKTVEKYLPMQAEGCSLCAPQSKEEAQVKTEPVDLKTVEPVVSKPEQKVEESPEVSNYEQPTVEDHVSIFDKVLLFKRVLQSFRFTSALQLFNI